MSYWYYRSTGPRDVKGGIKAQTKRGAFGQSWWAKRWINILDDFDIDERLARGRTYARRGQVVSIHVKKGAVTGSVQGSTREPYSVVIKVKTLPAKAWKMAVPKLFARPDIAAGLLAGRMPEEVEEIFAKVGYSLLPSKGSELKTDCDCYDWSNPCKHVAAVYYILAEEFDRDPFLVFKMRGADVEDLLKAADLRPVDVDAPASLPAEPLLTDPDKFWGREGLTGEPEMSAHEPEVPAALPKQLGSFPLWRGKEKFMPAMEEIYERASPAGMDAFLDRQESREESGNAGNVQRRRARGPSTAPPPSGKTGIQRRRTRSRAPA